MKRLSTMQLVTIFVYLWGLFGTTIPMNNNLKMTGNDVEISMNDGLLKSCIFGVKSVSMVMYTSDIPQGTYVEVNKSCNLFDPSKPVYFMTHGFIAHARWSNINTLATLLLKHKNGTIFSLDWADASCYNDPAVVRLLEYPFAVRNTREIGDYLASFTKSVIATCGVSTKDITFIGHSLGAHISSFAAKNLQNSTFGEIPLLIGTDPAAPLFMFENCKNRFCDLDATRVVALHTSSLGLQYSVAHLDLWFNNGFRQPACGLFNLDLECSHNIAVEYLAYTLLNNCVFIGIPVPRRTLISVPKRLLFDCPSNKTNCIVVDNRIFDSKDTIKGDYCVHVTSKYPYCTKNDFTCQK